MSCNVVLETVLKPELYGDDDREGVLEGDEVLLLVQELEVCDLWSCIRGDRGVARLPRMWLLIVAVVRRSLFRSRRLVEERQCVGEAVFV